MDWFLLAMYLSVLFKNTNRDSFITVMVFMCVILISINADFFNSTDDVYLFPVFSTMYLLLTGILITLRSLAFFGSALMSLYCAIYSFDCWLNEDVETWVWVNHEVFIITIHIIIMLLLSALQPTLVGSRCRNFVFDSIFSRDVKSDENNKDGKNSKADIK